MSDNPFIIGLTGSLGSGVTTISRVLENEGFVRVSISEPIKETFREIYGHEPTLKEHNSDWRAELQEIGNRGRKGAFSDGSTKKNYWIDLALKKTGTDSADNIVIDGIRNKGEVEYLRDKYSRFRLVAICADFDKRWGRIEKLNLYLNKPIFTRDDERDADEDDTEGQDVEACVSEADYVLINNEELTPEASKNEVLRRKIVGQIPGMKGQSDFRRPLPREVFMATAVSQSHASQCIKRKVGALIVDEKNKIPLTVGYNDNPIGMESCFSLYNGLCYKEKIMETKLEEIGPIFCPECGKRHEKLTSPWKCDGKIKENGKDIPCRCNFKKKLFPSRNMELCTAIHAEERAIRSLHGRCAENCTIYVNTFPCFQCARYIKDCGIKKVMYVEAYPIKEAFDFFKDNDIKVELFEGFKPRAFNQVFKQID